MPEAAAPWRRLPGLVWAAAGGMALAVWARCGALERAMGVWSRMTARAVGLEVRARGTPAPAGTLVAANHVGYLDILALGATTPGRFLAKAEIAGWPLLGWLARQGGTVFLERERPRHVREWIDLLVQFLGRGERLILFPEAGVSPDGVSLEPFRPMVFEAAVRAGRPVVPVALCYVEPEDPRVWAWTDEPSLWKHLWHRVLPAGRIVVEVRFGRPLFPDADGRKGLARRARDEVARMMGV